MKEIVLSGGEITLVDDEDFEMLNKHSWSVVSNGGSSYARRATTRNGKDVGLLMHRVIMAVEGSERIDHINRNGLDNQKHNLRKATPSQNSKNKKAHGRSIYLGVCLKKGRIKNKWVAAIKPDVKTNPIHIGYFATEELAALAYNKAAKIYHGEFANLNIL